MTFLSVFQIVSNKSIPRKRPREVALSTSQTFGFPIPFSLLPLFLPFSSVMLVLRSLEWHGDRSPGPSVAVHSSQSWKLLLPACLHHIALGLLGPTAWGGFRSILRDPLSQIPLLPLPQNRRGGQLTFPIIPPPFPSLPHSFPATPLFLVSLLKGTGCLVGICSPWLRGHWLDRALMWTCL